MKYDYLIVGAGLYGSVFAYEARKLNKKCLVIDKRPHIGGNSYTETKHGIHIHKYGAHIFHTNNQKIWEYVNNISPFRNFVNSPIAKYKNKIFNLPFNMNTFYQLWGVTTPEEAKLKIKEQTNRYKTQKPSNLEEQALSLVGEDIYFFLIKGYTEKQWGRTCTKLPPSIIQRIPLRFTFNNNYFSDEYQGIPINGYTHLISKLLENTEIQLNTDFKDYKRDLSSIAKKIIYTGSIDEFFDYSLGQLEYRSLIFKTEVLKTSNYQGVAVVNFTDEKIPYTRIIEHKHFISDSVTPDSEGITIITQEYPCEWSPNREAFYPINDNRNQELYKKYIELSAYFPQVHFGGRLGQYKYFDMDKVIIEALDFSKKELYCDQ